MIGVAASRPEVLAPAGDRAALEAAVRAGADAVYFGVQAWNARARASNFDEASLPEIMRTLHTHGVKGYLTLNTLVFDDELPALERLVRSAAAAGVDAVIVQDLGVARLVTAVAPGLALHASTQMTCTDASAVEFARSLGAKRVVLARELSLQEIARIREQTDLELEVFVHGALCIAYSGQCLTSEAIGGRSANRGACAQACRLPYELVVDGRLQDTGEKAHLLSPEDLEASALVPQLVHLGVRSLKIEGRLKGPEYVAASTQLYRRAVANALGEDVTELEAVKRTALLSYSRGSGPGFLGGVDHQRLVEGRTCEHRGVKLGVCKGVRSVRGRRSLVVALEAEVARGQGVFVEGGRLGRGEAGGRVWAIDDRGRDVERAPSGREVALWLGPDARLGENVREGARVFLNGDPAAAGKFMKDLERDPHRVRLDVRVSGEMGQAPLFEGRTPGGHVARVRADFVLEPARNRPLDPETARVQLGRLGESPFALGRLQWELPANVMIPVSALNRTRRALVEALVNEAVTQRRETSGVTYEQLAAGAVLPDAGPPGGLFALCRNAAQAEAALAAGADGVYLDFLELTGLGACARALKAAGAAFVGVAPPRIRKPGEEKIDRFLASLEPDAVLVRGLGALHELGREPAAVGGRPLFIGDFSLNVANRLSAAEVLGRGLAAFTPSFDLNAEQLLALLSGPLGAHAELVLHHPMPLFHMEHCVIAALLSSGKDFRTCGRPCERHQVSLRDRAGLDHPVEADVGCRNTVFHAAPQSAAGLLPRLRGAGVGRFRIELVRETASDVANIVNTYRALLEGRTSSQEARQRLRASGGYGVVSGSLRVLG